MEFIELRAFAEVARHGGVTAAAEQMRIAKSAVSKHLSRLEARLGVKLLERSSRSVRLTKAGTRLLPRVESLLAETELLVASAQEEKEQPEGLVRMASTPEFGTQVAHLLAPVLQKNYPGLSVAMTSTYRVEDLGDPAYDLALRISQVADEQLVAHPLGQFHRIVVAAPSLLANYPIEQPEDLLKAPCLNFSGRSHLVNWAFEHVEDPDEKQTIEIDSSLAILSFTSLLSLAEQGIAVVNVPEFLAQPSIEAGRVRRVFPQWQSRPAPVYLVHRVGAAKIQRTRLVRDLCLELLPQLLRPLP